MAASATSRPHPHPAEVPLTSLLKQLEQAVRQEMDRRLRPLGLTSLQYTALSVLDRQPGTSAAQLARRSFVSPQAASEMVAALERKGLITRAPEPGNQRILEVRLTRQGRAVLRRGDRAVGDVEARLLAGTKAAERKQFRALLLAGVENLRA